MLSFGKKQPSHVRIVIPEARFTLGMVHVHKVYVEICANGEKLASKPVVPGPADPVSHRFKCVYSDVSLTVPLLPWDAEPVFLLSVWDRSRRHKTCLATTEVSVKEILLDPSGTKTYSCPSTLFPTLNTKLDVIFEVHADEEDVQAWQVMHGGSEETDALEFTSESDSVLSEVSGAELPPKPWLEIPDANDGPGSANHSNMSSKLSLRSYFSGRSKSAGSRGSQASGSPAPLSQRVPRRHRKKENQFSIDLMSDLVGIVYLDIVGARNLPRFRTMTGLSFDMDPFVVISCGKKTFKTQYRRHTTNPTFNQRIMIMIDKHEQNYTIHFTVWDKDRITLNDRVGQGALPIPEICKVAEPRKSEDGIYQLEDYESISKVIPLEIFDVAHSRTRGRSDGSQPQLLINFHYLPYSAVRQQMWRGVISMYDGSDTDHLNKEAVKTMLQSIGSTLTDEDLEEFFGASEALTASEIVKRLERQLEQASARVISFRVCPVCQLPQLGRSSSLDSIKHISFCASQQWSRSDAVLLDHRYVTSAQASRKWYSRFLSKFSYGKYQLGANNANILVQDRISGQISEEKMSTYVRIGMRVLYATGPLETRRMQRMLKKYTLKQGIKYDSPESANSIAPFIKFHSLDMSDVRSPISEFKCFNEFFYRKLKDGARPCENANEPRTAVSLADCRLTAFDTISTATEVWIKGKTFSVAKLLGDTYPDDVKRYDGGSLVIFRLAPQDYHRFHIPVDGMLGEPKHIHGHYYTVNPMAIRSPLDVYGMNARTVVPIDSPEFGRVMVVLIGAMMVGGIEITAQPGPVKRTDELGYFKFGGSTVVLLFEKGKIVFDHDLLNNSKTAVETLVRVGMSIGHTPDIREHVRVYDTRPNTLKRAETTIGGGGSYMPFSLD